MQKDKIYHNTVSFLISGGIALIIWLLGSPWIPSLIGGILGSLAAGFAKEYGDSKSPNNKWDWEDIEFDVYGAFAPLSIYIIVELIKLL